MQFKLTVTLIAALFAVIAQAQSDCVNIPAGLTIP
jgi:hypothetical protein